MRSSGQVACGKKRYIIHVVDNSKPLNSWWFIQPILVKLGTVHQCFDHITAWPSNFWLRLYRFWNLLLAHFLSLVRFLSPLLPLSLSFRVFFLWYLSSSWSELSKSSPMYKWGYTKINEQNIHSSQLATISVAATMWRWSFQRPLNGVCMAQDFAAQCACRVNIQVSWQAQQSDVSCVVTCCVNSLVGAAQRRKDT